MSETLSPESTEDKGFIAPSTGEQNNAPPDITREIKEIGYQQHGEERSEIAKQFWENRRGERENKELRAGLQQNVETLRNQVADAEKHTVRRWYSVLIGRIGRLNNEIATLETQLEDSETKSGLSVENETGIKARINQHYDQLRQEWENLPYDRAEMERLFTSEHLSSISTDNYLTLLRRFPATFLTHVTRQGVRDHTGMLDHTAGSGEKHDGMVKLLEDGHLRSALGIHFVGREAEEGIASYFEHYLELTSGNSWEEEKSPKEKLLEHIDYLCRGGEAARTWGGYGDTTAFHFGLNAVLDGFYGAERGNECFVVWPTALLANEYQMGSGHNDSQVDKNNDFWVFAKERDGVEINAGLVFLPETTPVDPENGSKYQLSPEGSPLIDEVKLSQIESAVQRPEMISVAIALEKYWSYGNNHDPENENALKQSLIDLGIEDTTLLDHIMSDRFGSENLRRFSYSKEDHYSEPYNDPARDAKTILEDLGLQFLRAEKTVSAKEYWEGYFTKHPEQRPGHVVYYSGSPHQAFARYLQQNNISYSDSRYRDSLGNYGETEKVRSAFEDKTGRPADYTERLEEFRALAMKVVEEHFAAESTEV